VQHLGVRTAGGDPQFLQDMIAAKFLGKKVGKGYFLYDAKGKRQGVNTEVQPILEKYMAGRPDVCPAHCLSLVVVPRLRAAR
jgi:3-hydroxyacyl-CoA dehydrogenase